MASVLVMTQREDCRAIARSHLVPLDVHARLSFVFAQRGACLSQYLVAGKVVADRFFRILAVMHTLPGRARES